MYEVCSEPGYPQSTYVLKFDLQLPLKVISLLGGICLVRMYGYLGGSILKQVSKRLCLFIYFKARKLKALHCTMITEKNHYLGMYMYLY